MLLLTALALTLEKNPSAFGEVRDLREDIDREEQAAEQRSAEIEALLAEITLRSAQTRSGGSIAGNDA